jgi:imidazolonepropionase-like amidohydrolase
MGTLIENAVVVTMDAERRVLDPGHLLIEGRRLTAVGPGPYPGGRAGHGVHDAAGRIVVPGLVNGHTHSYGEGGRVVTFDESAVLAEAADRGRRLVGACREDVRAARQLHPELAAMLRRAYARPTEAVAGRWHG